MVDRSDNIRNLAVSTDKLRTTCESLPKVELKAGDEERAALSYLGQQRAVESLRFGIEVELTARTAALSCRLLEVPISYRGRNRQNGKKIGILDGFRAVFCIFKYGFQSKLKR